VTRFVLRFNGDGEAPAADISRIQTNAAFKIVDSSARMLLVDAPDEKAAELQQALPQWSLSRERFVPVPDTRRKLR
jgi:hypothetical protein